MFRFLAKGSVRSAVMLYALTGCSAGGGADSEGKSGADTQPAAARTFAPLATPSGANASFATAQTTTSAPAGAPVAATPASVTPTAPVPNTAGNARPGSLIVRFAPSLSSSLRQAPSSTARLGLPNVAASLRALHSQHAVSQIRPIIGDAVLSSAASINQRFPARTARGVSLPSSSTAIADFYELTVDASLDIEQAARAYAQDPNVLSAEPNRTLKAYTYDEYFYAGKLWALDKIQADSAWAWANGWGTVVAVVDSGVDTTHPDLAANIYTNSKEIPNNGIDDDHNGFVDDVHGWDFVDNDNLPQDDNGHGTHVAGIIGAVQNNVYGTVGVAYAAKLMPVRGLGATGAGTTANLANAMMYAINNGAAVINNSWGGSGRSPLIDSIVAQATAKGVIVVCAAGNDNADASFNTPANTEYGIVVGATTNSDTRAGYSNFGQILDLSAPGGDGQPLTPETDILSTSPRTSYLQSNGYSTLTGGDGARYMALAGTSMAAPYVSGVAAMLVSQATHRAIEDIRATLRQSADDILTPGFDVSSGYGRLNAYRAAMNFYDVSVATAALYTPYNGQLVSGSVNVTGIADNQLHANWTFDVGPGNNPSAWRAFASQAGNTSLNYRLDTLDVQDGVNTFRISHLQNPPEDRNIVTVNNDFLDPALNGSVAQGSSLVIRGQTPGHLSFQSYTLDYTRSGGSTWTTIATSATQVNALGALATWNLTGVPDGIYTVRLRTQFAAYTDTDTATVRVDRTMLPGYPRPILRTPTLKSPKIADLDQDGVQELIYGASVFTPSGSLKPGFSNDPGEGRTNPAIVNVDGDRELELVAVEYGASNIPTVFLGNPVVHAYNPDKSIVWTYTPTNPSSDSAHQDGTATSVSVGDVDGDGKNEIVFGVTWNYNNSPYKTTLFVLDAATGAREYSFNAPGYTFASLPLADLDDDGALEIIVGDSKPLLHAYRYNGTELLGFPVRITSGILNSSRLEPVVGDLDGDMKYEILWAQAVNHDGTYATGWPASDLVQDTGLIAQLDGVGAPEAISGSLNSWVVAAYHADHSSFFNATLSNGENGYASYQLLNPPFDSYQDSLLSGNPTVYDVNGDGLVDLIKPAAMTFTNPGVPLAIYGYTGTTGALASGFSHSVLASSNGLPDLVHSTPAFGDLNGDGNADMVVAAGGLLYAWSLGVPATQSSWPMFQRDLRNTGTSPLNGGGGVVALHSDTSSGAQCVVLGSTPSGTDGSVSHAACADLTAQMFKLERAAAGQVRLRHFATDRCLAASTSGASSLVNRACSTDPSMAFKLVAVSAGAFRFQHVSSGLCVSQNGAVGGTVTTAPCSTTDPSQVINPARMHGENLSLKATASAPKTFSGYSASRINDGLRDLAAQGSTSWASDGSALPQSVSLDFGTPQTFDRIDLYTSFGYAMKSYELQFWDGAVWRHLLEVTNNVATFRSHVFTPITSSQVRLIGKAGSDKQSTYARVNELEVYKAE